MNLLIVDDEETTRSGLLELVPWTEWGIDAVRTAENGLAALKVAESFAPSILLTDIRMPKMNGIELSNQIRQMFPNCIIIFLSGFSDKAYLKSAIQLNAVDYLEKPIEIVELKSLFLKIIPKLKAEVQEKKEVEHFRSSFHENLHLLRQEMVLELIMDKSDLSSLLSRYGAEALQLSMEGIFTAICVIFNWNPSMSNEEKLLAKQVALKLLNQWDPSPNDRFIAGFVNDFYLVIAHHSAAVHEPPMKSFGRNLITLLQSSSSMSFTVSVGFSTPSANPRVFHELYKAALETVKKQFYHGVNQLFFPTSLPLPSYEMDKAVYSRFTKMLRNKASGEAIQLARSLTAEIADTGDPDINKVRSIYFHFLRTLFEVTMEWDIIESGELNENIFVWQEIEAKLTLQELSEFLIANIEIVLNKTERKENTIDKMDEIKKYLKQNYTSNQLSIQSIAEFTYLSQTYLCAYFKKSTGRTINEYITELRIDKAKELLRTRDMKLNEITTSIGLTDTNYFSTLFKKYAGMTPSEYREKHLYDKKAF